MQNKIAIVSHPLYTWGGAELNLKVLSELYPEADIFTAWCADGYAQRYGFNKEFKTSFLQKIPFRARLRLELIPLLPMAYSSLDLSGYSKVFVISDGFEKLVRVSRDSESFLYIMTPPRFLWLEKGSSDRLKRLTYRLYQKMLWKPLSKRWKKWDFEAVRRFKKVFANSEEIQKRVWKYYQIDSEVIYPPVDLSKVPESNSISEREEWYLYFGRLENYKGVDLAIKACTRNKRMLKIAGTGSHLEELQSLVKELGVEELVQFLGYVTEDEKWKLLKQTKALLYPVFNEDFGIVPVEASACGTPVIAYANGGVLETVKDGVTGVFFKQYDDHSLADAIGRFENMKFSAEECEKNAKRFGIETYALRMRELFG